MLLELREQAEDDDEDDDAPPRSSEERRAHRARILRDAGADAGDGRARRRGGRPAGGRSARCATSRWIPTGTSARGGTEHGCRRAGGRTRRSERSAAAARRRGRGARPHAVVVERDVPRERSPTTTTRCSRSTSRSAASGRCGTSRRARCATARSRRYEVSRGTRLGDRARHRAARRPGRHRHDAALRRPRSRGALLHAARDAHATSSGAWPRSTSWSTTPTARAGTACSRSATATSSASTTACRSTRSGSCAPSSGTSPASRSPTPIVATLECVLDELDGALGDGSPSCSRRPRSKRSATVPRVPARGHVPDPRRGLPLRSLAAGVVGRISSLCVYCGSSPGQRSRVRRGRVDGWSAAGRARDRSRLRRWPRRA